MQTNALNTFLKQAEWYEQKYTQWNLYIFNLFTSIFLNKSYGTVNSHYLAPC